MSKSLSSRSLLAASIFMAGAAYSGLSYAADEAMKPEVWDVSAPDYSVDAQTIPLSVSEGTWMNLDVSPDGSRIAFDLLGDIYEIPITGGKASPLLSGHAWEIQPQYSPDGRFLAFTSDRNGATTLGDGAANPTTSSKSPTRHFAYSTTLAGIHRVTTSSRKSTSPHRDRLAPGKFGFMTPISTRTWPAQISQDQCWSSAPVPPSRRSWVSPRSAPTANPFSTFRTQPPVTPSSTTRTAMEKSWPSNAMTWSKVKSAKWLVVPAVP